MNPNSYTQEGTQSPEGQAFLLLMEAAWRDWIGGGGVSSDVVVGSDGEGNLVFPTGAGKSSPAAGRKGRGRRGVVLWAVGLSVLLV